MRIYKNILITIFIIFTSFKFIFANNFVVTYRSPESKSDKRFEYTYELLKTALEKTKNKYGTYKLVPSPRINFRRTRNPKYAATLTNFIFELSVSKENEKDFLPIRIPLMKGVIGYRLFLIHKDSTQKFSRVKNLSNLKNLKAGQGIAWLDYKIFKKYGFNITHGSDYEALFLMLYYKRFDYFPRGVNEIFIEYNNRRKKFPGLKIEKDLCLYYPLPRYFYTIKDNKKLAKRVSSGLKIMINDNTFDKIFNKHYRESLKKANLKNRKIFRIKNPFLPASVPFNTKIYWYSP